MTDLPPRTAPSPGPGRSRKRSDPHYERCSPGRDRVGVARAVAFVARQLEVARQLVVARPLEVARQLGPALGGEEACEVRNTEGNARLKGLES